MAAIGADSNSEPSEPIFEDFKKMLDDAYDTLEVTSFDGAKNLLANLNAQHIKIALNTG